MATVEANNTDKAQQLLQLFSEITAPKSVEIDPEIVRTLIRKEMEALGGITRIEVRNRSGKLAALEGHHHPMFSVLCRAAACFGRDGYVPGIFLKGETSSGKTTGARNLAKVLSLPFRFNGAISMSHEMLGFIDAHGNYHTTPFRQAYEHGGVYCFDEVDRSDANALLAVNPHLANGLATFPDQQVSRHPDCIIICTGNTWGSGADAQYSGATKLDAAFLSRFPVKIQWDIDEAFERKIVGDELWVARVQAARKRAQAAGLKVMIDTRCALSGAAMIEAGFSSDEAAQHTYLANMTSAQREMVEPTVH